MSAIMLISLLKLPRRDKDDNRYMRVLKTDPCWSFVASRQTDFKPNIGLKGQESALTREEKIQSSKEGEEADPITTR